MSSSTVALTLILCVSLGNGRPNEEVSHASSSQSSSLTNGYSVAISQSENNGQCVATVKIHGNGIDKVVESLCQDTNSNIFNNNGVLMVGEYFSDTHGVLVHVKGDKCEKEEFQVEGEHYTSKVEPMNEKECDEVREKIEKLKEEQKKWNEWMIHQQEETQKQMQAVQNSLQEMFASLPALMFGK